MSSVNFDTVKVRLISFLDMRNDFLMILEYPRNLSFPPQIFVLLL